MRVREVTAKDLPEWRAMRLALWPDATTAEDDADMWSYLDASGAPDSVVLVAQDEDGHLVGFIEARIRDYADGCSSRNVGYIEGWYVREPYRRHGVGAALVRAAEAWAARQGCTEMASDCVLLNEVSHSAHLALGYEEVERLILFRKTLPSGRAAISR